jgi:hypothetical protein
VTARSSLTRLAATGVFTATIAVPLPVVAQEATPSTGSDVVACTVEPRDPGVLVGFYFDEQGTPLATPAPTSVATEADLPPGEPVAADTEAAVNAVLAEMFVCFDFGQYARGFALMTDDLARQTGPDVANPDEDSPEEVRALLENQLATPVPGGEEIAEGLAIDIGSGRDLRTLDDGRVGGIWTFQGDGVFVVFAEEDGRWLADEIIDIADDAMAGTPTP